MQAELGPQFVVSSTILFHIKTKKINPEPGILNL